MFYLFKLVFHFIDPTILEIIIIQEKFMFTGEHVFPWMFEESAVLRPFRGTAEILAQKNDWSPIYDKGFFCFLFFVFVFSFFQN